MGNIILIGMMGAGKNTVGHLLAERTNRQFIDTDALIEEIQGCHISEIFERHGAKFFRKLEHELIQKIKDKENCIVATGGGTILNVENVLILRQMGDIVYLRAQGRTLNERLKDDVKRPLLKQYSPEVLLMVRSALYEKTANFSVDVDSKAVDEIITEIMNLTLPYGVRSDKIKSD